MSTNVSWPKIQSLSIHLNLSPKKDYCLPNKTISTSSPINFPPLSNKHVDNSYNLKCDQGELNWIRLCIISIEDNGSAKRKTKI